MTTALWFTLVGALLLAMGMISPRLRHLPVTTAIIYLAVGLLFGPSGLNTFHFNPLKEAKLMETLTEVAVLISLFSAGVKMPVPFKLARWRTSILLATLAMLLTVVLVAAFCHLALGLPLGAAVLLGAIVAPTDPVLATDVQVRHPGDRDQLRFTLTCEAGMNDGSAFPFVMLGLGLLGLHELGEFNLRWALVEVLWATLAGVAIGALAGAILARACWKLRKQQPDNTLLDDFLGLGLIGVVYGLSVLVNAWGFLAVFFAAVALRQTELKLAAQDVEYPNQVSPDGTVLKEVDGTEAEPAPTVSEGSLVFKEHLERLSEMVLILLLGGSLYFDSWSWRGVALALFLFVVARPASVMLCTLFSGTPMQMRLLTGWFGVRGIGSMYYLMFAISHGLTDGLALELIQLTLIVITLSILLHGTSVKPLLNAFWSRRKASKVE